MSESKWLGVIAEGEVQQLMNCNPDTTEESYMQVIYSIDRSFVWSRNPNWRDSYRVFTWNRNSNAKLR